MLQVEKIEKKVNVDIGQTSYLPLLTFVDIWTTTYLPRLVHVVCERPLIGDDVHVNVRGYSACN